MIECPNCKKGIRDSFKYCRFCGSKLDGEIMGDFTTDMLNVFMNDGEYLYLFSENGNQVILKAGSLDELAEMVGERQYPWQFRDHKSKGVHDEMEAASIHDAENDFLNAGSLNEQETNSAALNQRKDDDEDDFVYEIEIVGESPIS